jgi:hypothetical protein
MQQSAKRAPPRRVTLQTPDRTHKQRRGNASAQQVASMGLGGGGTGRQQPRGPRRYLRLKARSVVSTARGALPSLATLPPIQPQAPRSNVLRARRWTRAYPAVAAKDEAQGTLRVPQKRSQVMRTRNCGFRISRANSSELPCEGNVGSIAQGPPAPFRGRLCRLALLRIATSKLTAGTVPNRLSVSLYNRAIAFLADRNRVLVENNQ